MTDEQVLTIAAVLLAFVAVVVGGLVDWLWNRRYVQLRGYLANKWWTLLLGWIVGAGALWWILYVPFYLTYFGHH